MSRVQFIEIDIEIGVFEWDGKSEDKDKWENTYAISNIDLLVDLALFPDEDQDYGADEIEEETYVGGCPSFDSCDHEIAEGIRDDLWDSNN